MPNTVAESLPEGVYEHAGLWWRPRDGATSTFEENIAARALFRDLHEDEFWNPWRLDERAEDLERAVAVMEQWERAEPGFQRMTKSQWDAEMARWDRDWETRRIESEALRRRNRERYDRGLERARLELLEQERVLAHRRAEVAKLRSGESYPSMDPPRRSSRVAELDEQIVGYQDAIERLTAVVGDVEDVPDEHGYLPKDRRHSTLFRYREFRIREVRRIRESLPSLEAQLKGTADKAERSALRARHEAEKMHLERLLAVRRLEAENMCADCASPAHGQGHVPPQHDWPCPAWPSQRAAHEKVMQILQAAGKRQEAPGTATPSAPVPQPLAVIPSGLAVEEVVERLQKLQEQHPGAEVRRGRANRWELWPKAEPPSQ